eukprot:417247-Rhodomonas_salina.1
MSGADVVYAAPQALSLRVNADTVHFFFNPQKVPEFPLLTEALKFYNHVASATFPCAQLAGADIADGAHRMTTWSASLCVR